MAQEQKFPQVPGKDSDKSTPNRKPIKHILIGSPKVVTSTIHYLQVIGYANVNDWSQPQQTGNPDEVMSILVRYILA
ncbi:hypothetical protein I8748_23920 [Nostoc sp. CENA67]|uniref:Uncharacterized protein n=1 Tax=Amazonocrinis nigriterrae CENA67 TaxID=2794033 RepID=A0A8J7LA70_9NOST|nr:hypothetical protein [Amazonocrinis nigriterrae]MBH8565193.1 hypothetical protein [Amazonocrinis nigriterrae CENA67]